VTKKTARLTVPELTKALKHPTRSHVLAILSERTASPKEMAQELDRSIRHITYHLEVLEKLDCVELVRTEPTRGGRVIEHFFRATKRPWLDRQTWELLDETGQRGITSTLMELVTNDIAEAMGAGTFSDPSDNHLSRTPMRVDETGWEEVLLELSSTLDRLLEIQARVDGRRDSQAATTPIKVEILHFRSPSPEGD
jgi:DNA-binding transcriptional ArsR family regulator